MTYDGLGRRIGKLIENSGDWNMTYNFYYDGQSTVEEQNGSGDTIKQHVWGTQYIDELVQTGLNDNPGSDDDGGTAGIQQYCDTFYWGCQDANYNLLGIVDHNGEPKERYEYTPYGQRTIYKSAGSSDLNCMSPIMESQRAKVSNVDQPYGICDVGHQGLFYDKEWGMYDNRTRPYGPVIARFPVTDPAKQGNNWYEYVGSNPTGNLDPMGLWVSLGKNVWRAEGGDTLSRLAKDKYGADAGNYACLWPVGDTKDHGYPNKIWPGDCYDASNLALTAGPALYVYMDPTNDAYKAARPQAVLKSTGDAVIAEIARVSGEGATPIQYYEFSGHSFNWNGFGPGTEGEKKIKKKGGKPGYWVITEDPGDPKPTFARAKAQKGPRRCWFTRKASGYMISCGSYEVGKEFARAYLRHGALVKATTPDVMTVSQWRPFFGYRWGFQNAEEKNGLITATTGTRWEGGFEQFLQSSEWNNIYGRN